jgi:hypothetical protein
MTMTDEQIDALLEYIDASIAAADHVSQADERLSAYWQKQEALSNLQSALRGEEK